MPARERKYPLSCPLCRIAMVGERSDEAGGERDVQRCFNCGTVVELAPDANREEDEGA